MFATGVMAAVLEARQKHPELTALQAIALVEKDLRAIRHLEECNSCPRGSDDLACAKEHWRSVPKVHI